MSLPLFNAVHDYSNKSLNDDDEVLYRSAQTVIIRHWAKNGRSQVVKWAFGAGATARLERERSILLKLDGVAGVVPLENLRSAPALTLPRARSAPESPLGVRPTNRRSSPSQKP